MVKTSVAVKVTGVTYYENGGKTVTVECSGCHCSHAVDWPHGRAVIGSTVFDCGAVAFVTIPLWAMDARFQTGYAKRNFNSPRPLKAGGRIGGGSSINDNAINCPAVNWEE